MADAFTVRPGLSSMACVFLSALAAALIGGCALVASFSDDNPLNTEDLGLVFVYIPPGTFTMGSPPDEPGRDADEKPHQVTLTKGFYLQTTEVTQGQWRAVMGGNPAYFKDCGDDCPVEQVSWEAVQRFVLRLNRRTGRHYRLPTEAEWEYACRAGSRTAFANGEITETGCGYDPHLDEMGWYCANADGKTHPVAEKQPNSWGLYDMHGNVWEWCRDCCGYEQEVTSDTYVANAVDPTGLKGDRRIIRGGCFLEDAGNCRSANRSAAAPYFTNARLGFRLVSD